MSKKGLFSVFLAGTVLSCGCQMIGSILNLGLSILPMLLLISIEDGSEVEQIVSLPLDRGEMRRTSGPADGGGAEYSVEIRDAQRNQAGGSATIIVRDLGDAGETVLWERIIDVPLHGVIETNILASLTLKCRLVEPPDQQGQGQRL